ncbi:HNH endonuclease signature motif containing protein [Brevundimonas sp.]|uniref:HNH endonuclease signature motif containing protein n=1 Tax=Brevundimonas sp. TaxID=1871086 RepID=UPI0028ABCAC7|nr:HNH endonuclease signature motif containing protein [Brevundimonas sp.]
MTNGYGQSRIKKDGRWRGAGAHQVAYYQATGRWERQAEGRLIRHLCHNRLCCNPAHLRGGTPAENGEDRIARRDGRSLLPARHAPAHRYPQPRRWASDATLIVWHDLQISAVCAASDLTNTELVTRLHRKLMDARGSAAPDISRLGLSIIREFKLVAWRWVSEPMIAHRAALASGLIALAGLLDDVLHLQEHGDYYASLGLYGEAT